MRLPSLLGLNLIYSLNRNRGELRAEIKTALEIPDSGFPNLGCAFSISVSIALAPTRFVSAYEELQPSL